MPKTLQKQKNFRPAGESTVLGDPVNRSLLIKLKADARCSYSELGKSVHLSAPAVYERVRRLESSGVILGHTIVMDPEAIGLPFCAFVRIATRGDISCAEIAAVLAGHCEIEECHSIAGEDNLLIKVRTPNPKALEELLTKIRQTPGVAKTLTTVVLQTRFERGVQVPAGHA